MKNSFLSLMVIIGLFFVVSCGGGGGSDSDSSGSGGSSDSGSCDFDLNSFANGSSESAATSYWECYSAGAVDYFAFFTDGTGRYSDASAFVWHESGCGSIKLSDEYGSHTISNFDGSVSAGVLTFTETNSDSSTQDFSCNLISL